MNKLTNAEATFLNAMNAHLKPDANRQLVINLLRAATTKGEAGRGGFESDVSWTDDELTKGMPQ
jgi:hypothetical protein